MLEPFSPVTEFIIIFTLPSLFWYAFLLYADERRQPTLQAISLATGALAWTAFTWSVVKYDIDRPVLGEFPARTLVYFAIPVGLALLFRQSLTARPLSQRLLVSLQLFRVIGLVFVYEHARGVLPGIFAEAAGWGDCLTALVAAGILLRYRQLPIPRSPLI